MRLKLISCDILTREVCAAVLRSENTIDVEFLPKGLHDIGAKPMRERLQEALDRVDMSMYSAVLFGYGLCNLGLAGLRSRSIPLIIPRAHDCITLFLGSRQRYDEYFSANPGTYYLTSGWIERGETQGELAKQSIQRRLGLDKSLKELIDKYGEEDGLYLYGELTKWKEQYSQASFIEMGVEPSDRFKRETERLAFARLWNFDVVKGDLALLQRMVDGKWSEEEFLLVPPHHQVIVTYDEKILSAWELDEHEQPRPAAAAAAEAQP